MTPPERPSPELSRGAGEALWRQIAGVLEQEIRAGAFDEADGRLPTERTLTERFQVNRHTVRRALQALAESGLVRTEQGRGVFVNAEMVEYPLGRRVRFTESLTARQKAPTGRILEAVKMAAPADARAALKLQQGERVWRIERLGMSEDRPIVVASHYFAARAFDRLDQAFQRTASITEALAGYGVEDYERRETRIVARPATAEETRLLDLPRGRPVLVTEGVNIDPRGRPIEFSVARFAADRVQLVT